MGFAPLPDALDLGRTCEVIAVSGLVEPATLAGSLAGLAAPVARMGLPPRADALDVGRAGEVIAVAWLLEPAVLAGGFARLSTRGLGAVTLAPDAAWVRIKKGLTVLALAFGAWTSHEPASPQAQHLQIAA